MSYESRTSNVTDLETVAPAIPRRVGLGVRINYIGSRIWRWGLGKGFPLCCICCGEPIAEAPPGDGAAPLYFLCPLCRARLSPSDESCCRRCGSPQSVNGGLSSCSVCRLRGDGTGLRAADPEAVAALDGVFWCWPYAPPISSVITAMKFRRLDFLADGLAIATAEHLRSRLPRVDGIVPVPLHWSRRWGRGYDQADLLATALASVFGAPRVRLLRRNRRTRAQSKLSERRRRANVRAAFSVRRRPKRALKSILLVDDVMTTGATLEAAASALKIAGLGQVWGLTVARTPQSGERSEAHEL